MPLMHLEMQFWKNCVLYILPAREFLHSLKRGEVSRAFAPGLRIFLRTMPNLS
jgi:hypothetical protein